VTSAIVAGASLATYAGGSWLANTRDVNAIQRALKLPKPARPAAPLPLGTDLRIPGLSTFVTPNRNFYRVDTAIVLPEILPANWQLRIHGMVQREVVLTFEDLLRRPLIEDWITLCCVSNPVAGPYIGNAKWLGASLRSLLQEAGIKAGADQLLCTSSDGFTSGTPVQTAMDGRDALLAVAMNGAALPVEHGFPARLVIPGLYGYVSACKWIVDIEATTYAANQAYWVPRGWDPQAPVKTESRIDVPTGQNPIKSGKQISIAGVAWAQHKGIDAVEVRVANGPWQQARLAAVPGIDCWRQWVYDWNVNVGPGTYLIEARATDKTGYTQTPLQQPPEPNGASGYPSVTVGVVSCRRQAGCPHSSRSRPSPYMYAPSHRPSSVRYRGRSASASASASHVTWRPSCVMGTPGRAGLPGRSRPNRASTSPSTTSTGQAMSSCTSARAGHTGADKINASACRPAATQRLALHSAVANAARPRAVTTTLTMPSGPRRQAAAASRSANTGRRSRSACRSDSAPTGSRTPAM